MRCLGGVLAARAGPKRAVYAGLVLLAASTLAFGFLNSVALLDAARFVEGLGGACSWAGGVAWIVAEAPPGRRGTLIGTALGAAIGGALFGPIIGTAAASVGRGPTFSAVVLISLALLDQARRLPLVHASSGQGVRHLLVSLRSRTVGVGVWLVALPAIASGELNVLGPLRLRGLGAGVAAIGATFLVASGCEAAVSPLIGRVSDRRGRLIPMRFGLVGVAVALGCFTLPSEALLLAALIVVAAVTLSGFWAPAMAMLSDAADAQGLDQGLAAAVMNLAWAAGQIAGSGAGGALAKAAGDGVPTAAAAGLCALTLAILRLAGGNVVALADSASRTRGPKLSGIHPRLR